MEFRPSHVTKHTCRDSVCYNNGDNCQSTLTRFVWAGDQLLWELRVPGGNNVVGAGLDATSAGTSDFYGRVSYFHAGGIDRPLLITKEGAESVVPRETWRGQFHKGTSPTTGLVRDCAQGGQTGCLTIAWPGVQTNAAHSWGGEQPDIRVWYGGLVDGMRDASGQMYMRNRYYDPATGQFTQTDPIGLAGGLNAYGFAAGDPVSYADPYGLCPPEDDKDDCATMWWAERYNNSTTLFGRVVNGTMGTIAACLEDDERCGPALMMVLARGTSAGGSQARPGSAGGPGAGRRFTPQTQDAARARDGDRCVFCGGRTIRSRVRNPARSNIDHATPASRGGNNTIQNAQNTCQFCNEAKGTQTTAEYRQTLQQRRPINILPDSN